MRPVLQTNQPEHFKRTLSALARAHAGIEQGHRHILQGAVALEQVEALKYKANLAISYVGKLIIR